VTTGGPAGGEAGGGGMGENAEDNIKCMNIHVNVRRAPRIVLQYQSYKSAPSRVGGDAAPSESVPSDRLLSPEPALGVVLPLAEELE